MGHMDGTTGKKDSWIEDMMKSMKERFPETPTDADLPAIREFIEAYMTDNMISEKESALVAEKLNMV